MENPNNIAYVCSKHASKPMDLTGVLPASLIGKFVKKVFSIENAGRIRAEAMWIKVDGVVDGMLIGTLDNDPVYIATLKLGDKVKLNMSEVCAIL